MLDLIRGYPDLFVSLFTYTGLSSTDVLEAVYVGEDIREDRTILSFFSRYISECSESGKGLFDVFAQHLKIYISCRTEAISVPRYWSGCGGKE